MKYNSLEKILCIQFYSTISIYLQILYKFIYNILRKILCNYFYKIIYLSVF